MAAVIITALAAAALQVASVTLPYLTGRVIDDVLGDGRRDLLLPLCLAFVAVALVRMALAYTRRTVSGWVSLGVEYDLRGLVFDHVQRLSFSYHDRTPVGQLMSRLTADLQAVRFFLGYGLIFLFMHLFTLVIVLGRLAWIDPLLALLALAVGPILTAVAWRYSRISNPILIDVQEKLARVSELAQQSAVGIRVIKSFGRERELGTRFRGRAGEAFSRSIDAARVEAFYQPFLGFLPIAGIALVLAVGGTMAINGDLSVGSFIEVYLLLALLMFPFRVLGSLVGNAQRAIAGGTRVFEVLDEPVDIVERPDARPLPPGPGAVSMRGVNFAYGDGPPVLRDVDLDIAPGTALALIGATGSGKTSLAQLIPRFYDPTAGAVAIDGHDVRGLRVTDVRRAAAVVAQEPFLFSMSIRDNIAYGVPGADDEAIWAAARAAQAERFIRELPDGLDTVIGERGFTLSGGQRQRVAIARALVTDPRILILDEATASVDASTEREIQRALASAMQGRTTLIIAHRRSTIALADEVAVIADGGIAARGTLGEIAALPVARAVLEGVAHGPELLEQGV